MTNNQPVYCTQLNTAADKQVAIATESQARELAKTIARGKKTFVEVGVALAEIRDLRLYRREYGGFAEYCEKKWGWSRQRAYQMMDAAEVQMSTMVDISTERAARELGKAEPEQRAGIVQAIVGEGAEVVKALPEKVSTLVDTETSARELAKAEPDKRPGVVQAIVDQGKHSYRLIKAAPIGKCHHVVTNEATARVLANVEPAERADLIKTVVEAGKPVTAAELKRHLPPPNIRVRQTHVVGAPVDGSLHERRNDH